LSSDVCSSDLLLRNGLEDIQESRQVCLTVPVTHADDRRDVIVDSILQRIEYIEVRAVSREDENHLRAFRDCGGQFQIETRFIEIAAHFGGRPAVRYLHLLEVARCACWQIGSATEC